MRPNPVKLSDICDIQIGRTPSRRVQKYWEGGTHPWASISDITKSPNLEKTKEFITDEAIIATKMKSIPAGTVLMSFKLSIGKIAIANRNIFTNEAIAALHIKETDRVYPQYLARALGAINFDYSGDRAAKGRTLNKVSLAQIEIPLLPLEEQKRIAAILDQADALRCLRQRAIDRLNSLSQSIFYEMFGDPVTNPKGWPLGTIEDLTASTQYGTSGKAGSTGAFPILRMGNLSSSGKIDITDLKYIDLLPKDIEKYTVKKGDILFNRTNSPDLVGKTAVYYGDAPFAYAGYLVRLRVNNKAVPEYISAYLNSPHGKKPYAGCAKQLLEWPI